MAPEPPLLAQRSLGGPQVGVEGGTDLGGCSSLSSLRSHRATVGDASDGERLWPPVLSWEEQSSADLGSYLGPASQVWLSCSQGVLATESASHETRSGAPRRPFQQIFLS